MKQVFVTMVLILIPTISFAWCSNYPDISVAEELKKSKLVVIGTVTSRHIVVNTDEDPEGYEAEIYTLKIDQSFVGPRKNEIRLHSRNTTARFPMYVGKKYFVFVHTDVDDFWVSNCGNSDEYDKSAKIISKVKSLLKKAHNQEDAPDQKTVRRSPAPLCRRKINGVRRRNVYRQRSDYKRLCCACLCRPSGGVHSWS